MLKAGCCRARQAAGWLGLARRGHTMTGCAVPHVLQGLQVRVLETISWET